MRDFTNVAGSRSRSLAFPATSRESSFLSTLFVPQRSQFSFPSVVPARLHCLCGAPSSLHVASLGQYLLLLLPPDLTVEALVTVSVRKGGRM